jgi:hypothetical protein
LIKHPDKSKGRNIASLIKSGNSKKKIFVTISEVEEREKKLLQQYQKWDITYKTSIEWDITYKTSIEWDITYETSIE